MNAQAWTLERQTLRGRFEMGTIIKADRKELEWYLLVLANSRVPTSYAVADFFKETEVFGIVIRQLLEVRLGEELHDKSHKISMESNKTSARSFWVSIAAAVFAGFATLFAGLQAWNGGQKVFVTIPQSAVSKSSLPLSPEIKQSPESKLPKTNDLALSLTNPAPVSHPTPTNR